MEASARRGRRSVLAFAVALASLAAGCRGSPPELVDLIAVSPPVFEPGDQLELIGSELPEGHAVEVTFRGVVHRAGEVPRRVSLRTLGATADPSRIVLTLDDELFAELVPPDRGAMHATFRGEVTVGFAANRPGAPPISGTLAGVTLDAVAPSRAEEQSDPSRARAAEFARFLGVELSGEPPLSVEHVAPASRARAAGLMPGDLLLTLDELNLFAPEDVSPRPGAATAKLEIERPEAAKRRVLELSVDGFRPLEGRGLLGLGLFVGCATLFLLSPAAWLRRVVRLLAERLARSVRVPAIVALRPSAERPDDPLLVESALANAISYVFFVGLGAGLAALSLGHGLLTPELDLVLLYAASALSLVTASFVVGAGSHGGRRWLGCALGRAAATFAFQLPIGFSVVSVIVARRSIHLLDLVRAQGGAPWQWGLLAEPGLLLAFVVTLAAVVPKPFGGSRPLSELDGEVRLPGQRPSARAVLFVCDWAHVFVVCWIAATLFLGGWQVPGVSDLARHTAPGLGALGAALCLGKCVSLLGVVFSARWATRGVRMTELSGVLFRWYLPLGALAIVLSGLWHLLLRRWAFVHEVGAWALLCFVLVVLVHFGWELARALRREHAPLGINPWL
jgi:NADH-quinone oxidoreductase subunit H